MLDDTRKGRGALVVGHAHVPCFVMNYDQLTQLDQLELALPCHRKEHTPGQTYPSRAAH